MSLGELGESHDFGRLVLRGWPWEKWILETTLGNVTSSDFDPSLRQSFMRLASLAI